MELSPVPPHVAALGLRALVTVARADGDFAPLERALIDAAQRHILRSEIDVDALEPIDAGELAAGVTEPEFRERIVRGCILVALIDGEAAAAEVELIGRYATALHAGAGAFKDLQRVASRSLALLRLDIARRSFIGKRVGQHVRDHGVRGLIAAVKAIRGGESPHVAERYQPLRDYPEGTLGRGYAEFIARNEFSFPGEKGGPPEPIVFHDCVHVLAEYDTTPIEETQAAAFQAGFQKYDPFFSLLFAFCQFQLGIEISPIAGVERGVIDPELLLRAFARGTHCKVDLSSDWDPWSAFDRPVAELRTEYNILPRT